MEAALLVVFQAKTLPSWPAARRVNNRTGGIPEVWSPETKNPKATPATGPARSDDPMFFKLLAAFIAIPLIELYLLLQLAQVTSVPATILIVIVTGVIGTMLARREGAMAWFRFHAAIAEGRMPSREIQDGLMIVFAGALLLTPGLLTDALGFALLIPVSRNVIRNWFVHRYRNRFQVQVHGPDPYGADLHRQPRGQADTIDAEAFHRKA